MVYEPYNLKQILIILHSRLLDVKEIFDERSLEFVARKVSTYSGDIRRSLQIAKRSVEICRENHFKHNDKSKPLTKVTYQNVMSSFEELFNSKIVNVLKNLQKNEVIVILSLSVVLSTKKLEKVNIDDV